MIAVLQHIVAVFAAAFTWLWNTGFAVIVCAAAVAVAGIVEWRRR